MEIINSIARNFECESYLEIGLRNPEECFNLIECENKDSVDPGFETDFNLAKYKYTSDSGQKRAVKCIQIKKNVLFVTS